MRDNPEILREWHHSGACIYVQTREKEKGFHNAKSRKKEAGQSTFFLVTFLVQYCTTLCERIVQSFFDLYDSSYCNNNTSWYKEYFNHVKYYGANFFFFFFSIIMVNINCKWRNLVKHLPKNEITYRERAAPSIHKSWL